MSDYKQCPKCGEEMDHIAVIPDATEPTRTFWRCTMCKYKEYDPMFTKGIIDPDSDLGRKLEIVEKITDEIFSKIPAGRRYDSMERLETKDGEIIIRITTKRDDDDRD